MNCIYFASREPPQKKKLQAHAVVYQCLCLSVSVRLSVSVFLSISLSLYLTSLSSLCIYMLYMFIYICIYIYPILHQPSIFKCRWLLQIISRKYMCIYYTYSYHVCWCLGTQEARVLAVMALIKFSRNIPVNWKSRFRYLGLKNWSRVHKPSNDVTV